METTLVLNLDIQWWWELIDKNWHENWEKKKRNKIYINEKEKS